MEEQLLRHQVARLLILIYGNSATTASITGVVASTYAATVTDANGCTASDNVTITDPAPEFVFQPGMAPATGPIIRVGAMFRGELIP